MPVVSTEVVTPPSSSAKWKTNQQNQISSTIISIPIEEFSTLPTSSPLPLLPSIISGEVIVEGVISESDGIIRSIISTIVDNSISSDDDPYPSGISLSMTMSGTQTEKPSHYKYLKEFRVEQCQLFPHHKCQQHRPYTCFNWHFPNQRRRRPIRKRDGTFNYSPDNYCTKYDEATGTCPDGDECPLLHRTAGDTERRYHLKYFKTGMCVHETDNRGFCTKNGAHCAFAHSDGDKRPPVFDIRDRQNPEGTEDLTLLNGPNQLDRERNMMVDDPKWQDASYVLAHYKTEACKRPQKFCRQGYACPQYHNERDRRRSPRISKYRSTPCPNVKHADEWGEPSLCDSGDACAYCHTRTEQQFHPEIYKSSKCHDVLTNQYCPRGPFCAFAHTDAEMQINRNIPTESNLVTDILMPVLPLGKFEDLSIDNNNQFVLKGNATPENGTVNCSDIFRSSASSTPGPTLFGTQTFANAVTLSYSNAAAGSVGNNGFSCKGFDDCLTKKNSTDSSEFLNGSTNIRLNMDSFIHVDPDGYSLFPTRPTPREELKGDDSPPNAIEKEVDSEHFGSSDISSPAGGSSKPVSIPSPGYFQSRERFPSGSSPMPTNSLLSSYNPLGSIFSKTESIDQGNEYLNNVLFEYSHSPRQTSTTSSLNLSGGPTSNGYPSTTLASRSVGTCIGNTTGSGATGNGNGLGPIGGGTGTMALLGFGSGGSNGTNGSSTTNYSSFSHLSGQSPWSTGGMNTLPNLVTRGSDLIYVSLSTLRQMELAYKFQLELIAKAKAAHDKSSPHYPCLNCKQKERYRSIVLIPCDHQVLCGHCAPASVFCPLCQTPIQSWKQFTNN